MTQEKKPHVHAELIKAWADGAAIQYLEGRVWIDRPSPKWLNHYKYRIKPEPIKTKRYRRWVSRYNPGGIRSDFEYHVISAIEDISDLEYIQKDESFVRWVDTELQDGIVVYD